MRTQAEGEQLPDVFWMNGPNIQLYASNDMLAPLDDDAADWSNYPKALVDLYTVDGKHYGIPKDYDTIACFVNKKIFDEAGVQVPAGDWTWEEHHAAAKAIAATGKYHGALIGVGSGQETYYNTIPQAGGFVIKDNKSGYDDPKTIAGIQYLRDMIADGSVPSLQVMTDTSPGDLFKSGKGGILWDGSWSAAPVKEAFPDPSQIVVVPLPKGVEQEADVFDKLPFWNQFGVSVSITVVRLIGQLAIASMAGYAFARLQFKGRELLFGLLLVILMVPGQVYLIPQYSIIKGLGLLETLPGIFLPGLFSAFATFLMRQAFLGLPRELEEAARRDGCNPWQTFWRVMLPLVNPSLFAVGITTVLWSWNDLLWPLIVTQREPNMPLSVGIATLAGQYSSEWGIMMAASLMAMAPIFILFFTMQKRVIDGLATSGMK